MPPPPPKTTLFPYTTLFRSQAHSFAMIIVSAGLVGMGSAIFHPEASRVAYMAAGRRRGLAQSVFQVGGNAGRSEEHTSELQSRLHLVCRLLLEKKKQKTTLR